jgi:hypothetical protein
MMPSGYRPSSPFLNGLLLADEVPLSEDEIARLIELMSDEDVSNRDWATMLLAQDIADSPIIRAALLERVGDNEAAVRAEALSGLALRDRVLALPLVSRELDGDAPAMPTFEAAMHIGDPALLPHLLPWRAERSEPPDTIDEAAEQAIARCAGPPLDR